MNGFKVYKAIKKQKNESNYKAENIYVILLGDPKKTVDNIFLNKPTDKHNTEIQFQAKILFNLRDKIFKKLFNKKIVKVILINQTQKNMKKVLQKEQD